MKIRICLIVALLFVGAKAEAQSLKGSPESIGYQYLYAQGLSLDFVPTATGLDSLIEEGVLVELEGNKNYELFKVSHPYVLSTTHVFIEWFAKEYRRACGEKLVLTSGTRPINEQPGNASPLSVHPTGLAVDVRVPANSMCRLWLETTALSFESAGELDVTLETAPWHYHFTVFIPQYEQGVLNTD
ncbi:MAG: DUF5715 family protein [Minisyncoccia bacterium]